MRFQKTKTKIICFLFALVGAFALAGCGGGGSDGSDGSVDQESMSVSASESVGSSDSQTGESDTRGSDDGDLSGSDSVEESDSGSDVETYWIHFSDGESIINSQEVVYGTTPQFPVYRARDGYVFLGWKHYTDGSESELISDGAGRMLSPWEYDFDITVFPETAYQKYTVTYISNGGTPVSSETFTMQDEIILPATQRENYRFMGWYEDEACLGAKVIKIPKGTKSNKTFYARWERTYTITYVDENWNRLGETEEAIAGEGVQLRVYIKDGYAAIWTGNRRGGTWYNMGFSDVVFMVVGWEPYKA